MNGSSIADIIKTYGTTAIANAMGLPISTVHTWKRRNALLGGPRPGDEPSVVYRAKVAAFETAIKQLRKQAKPRKRARAA